MSISQAPFISNALNHGTPPNTTLKRSKLAPLKFRVTILLIALLLPCKIPNSMVTAWSLHPRRSPVYTFPSSLSLFKRPRSCSTPVLHHLCQKIMFTTLQEPPGECMLAVLLFQKYQGGWSSPWETVSVIMRLLSAFNFLLLINWP